MAKRKPKKPPRPKLRKWFPHRGPTWLKLEPAGLATVGGLFFTACSVVVYLVRQLTGHDIALQDVVAGVTLTFVVSYAGTGLFVWYLLHLAEDELDHPHAQPKVMFESAPDWDDPPEVPMADVRDSAETEEQS